MFLKIYSFILWGELQRERRSQTDSALGTEPHGGLSLTSLRSRPSRNQESDAQQTVPPGPLKITPKSKFLIFSIINKHWFYRKECVHDFTAEGAWEQLEFAQSREARWDTGVPVSRPAFPRWT